MSYQLQKKWKKPMVKYINAENYPESIEDTEYPDSGNLIKPTVRYI